MEQLSINILFSAYACRPNMGSEPGVGWNTACEIAECERVWVITREDNRPFIEAEIAANPRDNINFIYCGLPPIVRWLCKPGQILHYYIWQISAYFEIRRIYKELALDLIHHVTYVRYSTPSFLVFLPLPFIWGSVGGGETTPLSFWQDFDMRAKVYEIFRRLAHYFGQLDPFTQMTAKRSALVRATTKDTARHLKAMGATNLEVFPESALTSKEIQTLGQYPVATDEPIRFISMARLLHWKGLHLGIRGFAQADIPISSEYWIFGDGPEQERLKALANNLGVADRVKFWGRKPRNESLQYLSECHVLVHPSLHDSGGWVCIEAMAMGRPVVCLDLGGPAEQVTHETGIVIPAYNPAQVVEEISKSLVQLASDRKLRYRMGLAGKARVKEKYSWEVRRKNLITLYSKIIAQKNKNVSAAPCIADNQ